MSQTVSAEGTVAAAQTDDLSFTSSGTVTAVERQGRRHRDRRPGAGHHRLGRARSRRQLGRSPPSPRPRRSSPTTGRPAPRAPQLAADATSVTSADDASGQRPGRPRRRVAAWRPSTAPSRPVDLTVGEQLGQQRHRRHARHRLGSGSGRRPRPRLGVVERRAEAGTAARPRREHRRRRRAPDPGRQQRLATRSTWPSTAPTSRRSPVGQTVSPRQTTSSSGGPGGFGRLRDGFGNRARAAAQPGSSADRSTAPEPPAATATGTVTDVATVADASSGWPPSRSP